MSNTLQTSINAVQSALGFWNPIVGTNFEPALSAANMVQQVMTSPPFRFPWNRGDLLITTVPGTQDYFINVADFGYLEKASGFNPTTNKTFPLSPLNVTPLENTSDLQQPTTLAVQQVNNAGTINGQVFFRFMGIPNNAYQVTVWYQKFAPLMLDPTGQWAAPDYMSYIYNRGLLAHLYEARGDMRAQQEKVAFAAALLATTEGLKDTEINLFLAQYLPNQQMLQAMQLKTQQGVQARGQ
jgi:hypothetical protein